MSECLEIEQIEEYVSGVAAGASKKAIETHLNECRSCRKKVEGHRTNEALLADVRRVYGDHRSSVESLPEDSVPGYRIVKEIHRGGQGVVFEAVQLSTKRTVALKVILGGPFASADARKRFEREATLAASLHHPHIVVIHDSGIAGGNPFIVMDYVDGVPISEFAARENLSIASRLELVATICDAVEYAHQQGVIHRDIKPSNVLVRPDGEPVLVDFGLARSLARGHRDTSLTLVSTPGQVLGSLPFISPEQATGDPSQIDERTDVYALGVLLYELLTGTRPPPVTPSSASTIPPPPSSGMIAPSQASVGLDQRLDPIVMKALEWNKSQRYRSSGDFAAVIRAYLSGQSPSRWSRAALVRRRAFVVLMLFSFAMTITTVGFLFAWRSARNEAMRRPPIPSDEQGFMLRIPKTWPGDYHGRTDTSLFREGFETFWYGLNPPLLNYDLSDPYERQPPLWEHLEGRNKRGSEGMSNSYVTRLWSISGERSLRIKTGVSRSLRTDAMNVWKLVKNSKRFYYQCWLHLVPVEPSDHAQIGFLALDPQFRDDENIHQRFTNALAFDGDGAIRWSVYDHADRPVLQRWTPGEEFVCFVRVELDFEQHAGFVWINGELRGESLPISPKEFMPVKWVGDRPFRLDRWGVQAPGTAAGDPQKAYQPRFADIDDLEFGTWEYADTEVRAAETSSGP